MSEPFLSEIRPFGFSFAPRGWAKCDGQLLPIAQNNALFSLLGTTYGGDGRTTFALPDMRGRASIHKGHGPGLNDRPLGERGGQESLTLITAQLPRHHHQVNASATDGTSGDPNGAIIATRPDSNVTFFHNSSDGAFNPNAISQTGVGASHDNVQPYLVLNFCIALVGIFPSRN